MLNALVIGATGLVGRHLIERLLADRRFGSVVMFVRNKSGIQHDRLTEHVIDFGKPDQWQHLVKGDVLFSALGTTRKKAGGKTQQYAVDHGYQFQFAAAAARNGVPVCVLVSAAGADRRSGFFYMRMKGQLESDIKELHFRRLVLIRPGPLKGPRKEHRIGEKIGVTIIHGLNYLGLFRKYRPIDGDTVSCAMVNASIGERTGVLSYALDELFLLAEHGAL